MRIMLLTVWVGPLPSWIREFRHRIGQCSTIHWVLVQYDSVDHLNRDVSAALPGEYFLKESGYAACDYRPMYDKIYSEYVHEYDWWGWVDLDVLVGDLDRLLPPALEGCDVLRVDGGGPMTIVRKGLEFSWEGALSSSEYVNFDEDGFGNRRNPSFERCLVDSGVRVRHDTRYWTESRHTMAGGAPSRSCELVNGKVVEVPTGRELLLYHFTMTPKTWPVPNRWYKFLEEQSQFVASKVETRVEESPGFWYDRLQRVLNLSEPVHKSVFDCDSPDWEKVQWHTASVIREHVCEGSRVLDAGCGPGLMYRCFAMAGKRVTYHGVDYCPGFIDYAKSNNPGLRYTCADLRQLPFEDDSFHVVVCRSVEGSIKTLVSVRAWEEMQAELLRVAPRLILIDMNFHHRVIDR